MHRRRRLPLALAALVLFLSPLVTSLLPAGALSNCSVSYRDLTVDSEEQELLRLINRYRMANGRNSLELSDEATRAAAWLSRDMADGDYFSHVDSLGRNMAARLADCEVNSTLSAENIAAGNATAQATFDQWKSSPGHDANMLRDGVTFAGIGRAYDADSTYQWYWALNVIRPASTPTTTTPTTTTVTSTTTTLAPTTTTTSTTAPTTTTTTAPTTTTTAGNTTAPTRATTTPAPDTPAPAVEASSSGDECAEIRAAQERFDARFSDAEDALAQSLSGPELAAAMEELEAGRAEGQARLDHRADARGCPPAATGS